MHFSVPQSLVRDTHFVRVWHLRSSRQHAVRHSHAPAEHPEEIDAPAATPPLTWVKSVRETRNSIVAFMHRQNFVPAFVSLLRGDGSDQEAVVVDRTDAVTVDTNACRVIPFELNKVDVYSFPSLQCIQHPTVQVMIDRKMKRSLPNRRRDKFKLGLVIEGGGMRGAVSGAMCMELRRLGFLDVFDVVYGSSAGAINGAYFLTGQEAGMNIYFEHLTSKRFIDFRRLFGPDPVLDLNFLIDDIMEDVVPLDWKAVLKSKIPLKVIASSLNHMTSVTLGGFRDKADLVTALKASCTVPEIVGPPEELYGHRLVDAAVFEPIPYRAAIQDGCTHVLSLCSRPRPRGASGRVRRAMKQILDRTIKRFVLSPPYMEGAWKVEVEEMLKAGGMDADDLMLLTMMQGLQGMETTPMDGHIFAIYPSPDHIIPPTTIDGELLRVGARDARKAVDGLFEPLAKNTETPNRSWLFV